MEDAVRGRLTHDCPAPCSKQFAVTRRVVVARTELAKPGNGNVRPLGRRWGLCR